jgi:hypothetical protein
LPGICGPELVGAAITIDLIEVIGDAVDLDGRRVNVLARLVGRGSSRIRGCLRLACSLLGVLGPCLSLIRLPNLALNFVLRWSAATDSASKRNQ